MEQKIYKPKPTSLLNSIVISAVNAASHTLISLASTTHQHKSWNPMDHLRYSLMLVTWITVWVLQVLMDQLFCYDDKVFNKGIGRALSHILILLNEIPATSNKYQFAVAIADKILDDNVKDGHVALQDINRCALSAAFARTSSHLYESLQQSSNGSGKNDTWIWRVLHVMPLGSYVMTSAEYLRWCVTSVHNLSVCLAHDKGSCVMHGCDRIVTAEKHALELLWITKKMRECGAVDEAVVQWSLASDLASLSLTANPRVQGSILKLSGILVSELVRRECNVSGQVKLRLLVLWIPLFCYSSNGQAYQTFSGNEMAEIEKVVEQVIFTLPQSDQEIILTNWLQDFIFSGTDWPNLQKSYDWWCRSSRKVLL